MCDCPVCKQGRRIEAIRLRGDVKEMSSLIIELQDLLLNMATDNERYTAILAGEWPNSEKYLREALKKIQQKDDS